jgi:hypothetical protein
MENKEGKRLWNGIKWFRIACSGSIFENIMMNPCVPHENEYDKLSTYQLFKNFTLSS